MTTEQNPESGNEKDLARHGYSVVLYWTLAAFAIFGFLFNVRQVEKSSVFLTYLVDVVLVSYTNFLAIPLLLFISFAKRNGTKLVTDDDRSVTWWMFFLGPFLFVGSQLVFRVVSRLLQVLWEG